MTMPTRSTAPRRTTRPSHLLSTARAFAPELSARADEAETRRHHARDLVDRFRRAGLFRALQPRALGGIELEPQAYRGADRGAEPGRRLGRAGRPHRWRRAAFAAWLEPAVALELFGRDADFTSATVFAPTGQARARRASAGTRVSGRWPFSERMPARRVVRQRACSCSTATPPAWSPTAGPTGAWRCSPRAAGEIVEQLGRDRVAGHGQQRRRRRAVTGAEERHDQSVLRAGAPRRPAVAPARSSRWPASRWSVCHSASLAARSTSWPRSHPPRSGPARSSRSPRTPPCSSRLARAEGAAAGGAGVRVRRGRLAVGDRRRRRRAVDHRSGPASSWRR